ncbi:MAG: hypothetical protein ABI758_01770 [Candidatus Woesebacteria bacterium]
MAQLNVNLLAVFSSTTYPGSGYVENSEPPLSDKYEKWVQSLSQKGFGVHVLSVHTTSAGDHRRILETMTVIYKVYPT